MDRAPVSQRAATGQPLAGGTIERRREIGRERRERTHSHLLTAAARVVAARGAENVTIEDFIQEAGVARGTFYNYFKTREEIIAALWRRLGDAPLRSFATAHARNPDPAYRLTTGLRMTVAKAAADPVWGWLLHRITIGNAKLNEELRAFPMFDLRAGIASGRFEVSDADTACDYFVGVSMMGVMAVLTSARSPDYAEDCAYLVLRGLGLDRSDARAVAHRPLPDLLGS